MALIPEQQAVEFIKRAKQILLITHERPTLDAAASVFALAHYLKKTDKPFDAVLPGWDPKTKPDFFPDAVDVHTEIGSLRALDVLINVKDVPLSEIMYDVKDDILHVTLIPKHGQWQPQHVAFKHGEDRYDLVIAVGCSDLASLGTIGREYASFFYRTPVINIDSHASNEHWGQVNLVDPNAVSVTETVYHWINSHSPDAIDAPLATALLSGIMANTKGFRTQHVTPRTLEASSHLVRLGADRDAIASRLWRTRSIETLKLWGRALMRLEQDHDHALVWTHLHETDLIETHSAIDAVDGVVDELIATSPHAKAVALFAHEGDGLRVTVHAMPPLSATDLVRPFNGHGTRERAEFFLPKTDDAEPVERVLQQIKQSLPRMI